MTEDGHRPGVAALLGAGVIGAGWAARLLLAGVDVRLFDPDAVAADAVDTALARARRAWDRLTEAPLPVPGALTWHDSVEEAVTGAQLIQESAPEREELKRSLLAQASRAADSEAIIATSTSGLRPSRLCVDMERPENFVVGHPFNPVYLLPLVEVCGCDRTSPETIASAAGMYKALGMQPLVVRHEIDGFIADRLLEALWREALWLVADDVATVEEIDDAIRFGPGLRWAAMGSFLTYRLAGGPDGMRHFMSQFGPALQLPWSRLTEVPALDDELLDKLVAQSDAQADGASTDELARIRDDCLVAVLRSLRGVKYGAGEVLGRAERDLWTRAAHDGRPQLLRDGRLVLHRAVVTAEWIDYNGHLTEYRYLQVLADATDAVLRHIGIDEDTVAAGGSSYYTVETHIRHLDEAHEGQQLYVASRVLSHDEKRLHLFHELYRQGDGALLATGEHMLLHVSRQTGRTAPAPEPVLRALASVAAAQRDLGVPEGAGSRVGPGRS